jgi:hypothetical protein
LKLKYFAIANSKFFFPEKKLVYKQPGVYIPEWKESKRPKPIGEVVPDESYSYIDGRIPTRQELTVLPADFRESIVRLESS